MRVTNMMYYAIFKKGGLWNIMSLMTSDEIFEKLKEILREEFSVSKNTEISPESSLFSDLEFDSLDLVDLISTIESEFGVEINFDENNTLLESDSINNITLKDIIDKILELSNEN